MSRCTPQADSEHTRSHRRRISIGSSRRRRERHLHDLLDDLGPHGVIFPASLRLVSEPGDAPFDESPSNPRDLLDGDADAERDISTADAIGAEQDHASPTNVAGPSSSSGNRRLELTSLGRGESDFEPHPRSTDHASKN